MQFEYTLDNGKPQAGTAVAGALLVLLIETLENSRHLISRYPAAGVHHLYHNIP